MKSLSDLNLTNRIDIPRLLTRLPIHFDRRPASVTGDPRFWSGFGLGIALGGALVALTHGPGAAERRASLRRRVDGIREKGSRLTHSEGKIEESIVIVPVAVAYDQWTQFANSTTSWGIIDVRQKPNASCTGRRKSAAVEWDSEIVEQGGPGRRDRYGLQLDRRRSMARRWRRRIDVYMGLVARARQGARHASREATSERSREEDRHV